MPDTRAAHEKGDITLLAGQAAEALGFTPSRLRQLCRAGKIEKLGKRHYSMFSVVRYARDQMIPKEPEDEDFLNLNQERARLVKIQADREEIKLAEDLEDLLPADEVKDAWITVLTVIKQRFRGLPQKLCQELAYLEDEQKIEALLLKEIDYILNECSKLED